jgi:hypothetical protein
MTAKLLNFHMWKISDRIAFEKLELSVTELTQLIVEAQEAIADKTPFYYRVGKSGLNCTLYNEVGTQIAVDTDVTEDVKKLEHVKTHKQFNMSSVEHFKILKRAKLKLCGMLRLPTFKNGELYAKSKQHLLTLNIK